MQDLFATEAGLKAEIAYRRHHMTTLRGSPIAPAPRRKLQAVLAEALAHLALHLDGGAIGSVTDRHSHPAGHGHGRPA